MENFIDSFNTVNTGFAAIILIILSIIMVISACVYFDILEEEIKKKKITKDSKKYKKIVKIEMISSILIFSLILISCILIFCHPKNNHINDLKTNYNITTNDYQITFNTKDKSLFMKNSQTFITLKDSNDENMYILESTTKPYERYKITKDEFKNIIAPLDKPSKSINIKKELTKDGDKHVE